MLTSTALWTSANGLIVCRHIVRSAVEHELAIVVSNCVVWSEVFAGLDQVRARAERLRQLFADQLPSAR